ncbi:MAG TPA: IPT/TIG domain-containing protein [Chloroflexota bacterium]|uniref:IPT/TIG domain-containing protein n=1 Tax=Ralstonia sp. TaxID=54061 RepID=UPI001EA8CAA2|nr:MAG: IPT/TIG domain-containing protein [Ralstonia sp.]
MPLQVASVTPLTGVPGTAITVQGVGLTRATRVYWGETELTASFQSADRLVVTLPNTQAADDASNTLTLRREDGARQTWTTPVTVEAVPVPTSMQPGNAREGQHVRLSGARLQRVKQIKLGDISAAPVGVAPDGSWLEFVVPSGAPSGTVVLVDAKGRGFPAGNLVVSAMAASLAFQDVQVYQSQLISVSQPTPSKYLRFAPGRDTMVRVRLVPNGTSDVYTSQVRLTVSNTALGSQTFVMQGPATLGAASVAESDLAGSYTYTVPGAWIGPGFRLDVAANDQKFPQGVTRFTYTPSADVLKGATYIRMHVVPIAPDSGAKVDLDLNWFKASLRGLYPLSDVDFVMEPPLAGPAKNDSNAWIDAVDALRSASNPQNYDFYFGVMPCDSCTGLGQVPGRAAVASHLWSGRKDAEMVIVMMHEVGHNFGRLHSWDDAAFPYSRSAGQVFEGPWNWAGGAWASVIDPLGNRRLVAPTEWHDVMSYSTPGAVSDYTYSGAYDYLEQNLPLSAKPKPKAAFLQPQEAPPVTSAVDVLYLAGRMVRATGQVKLQAPVRMKSTPDTVALAASTLPADGDYVMEVTTAQGRLRYPLQLQEVGDAEQASASFKLTIPALDGIQSVRVLRGLVALPTQTAAQAAKPAVLRAMSVPSDAVVKPWGTYRLGADALALTWNATRWPWISVWQKTDTGLVPVAVGATGGVANVSLRAPASGTRGLVISFSDGLNTTLESFDF